VYSAVSKVWTQRNTNLYQSNSSRTATIHLHRRIEYQTRTRHRCNNASYERVIFGIHKYNARRYNCRCVHIGCRSKCHVGLARYLDLSTRKFNQTYQISLTILISEPLQSVLGGQNLYLIDTSQTDALVTTGNLSTSDHQPFQIFAVLKDSDYIFSSLSNSYCVFRSNPSLFITANAQVSMTTRGVGGLPKQQFLLSGLNASTEYNVYLTLPSTNDTSSDQGVVYAPSVSIKTKTNDNCQLVFNLPFCTETAYAAPANPNILNSSALATFYDSFASSQFANFSISLQLTACNTTLSAQYSLFRNCTTCLSAYKNWLCAVTIPRCADITDQAPYLYERPVNDSRNPLIDQTIEPGAYKELMPCSDLCFAVEQNCPSTLSFTCPLPGSFAMQNSYVEDNTGKTCNAPQLQYLASRGGKVEVGRWGLVGIVVHLAFWIMWGYY
jgi:calcium channel MID1